jgi:hypothetical protein
MHHRVFQVFLRKKEGFELLLVLSTATGTLAFNNNLILRILKKIYQSGNILTSLWLNTGCRRCFEDYPFFDGAIPTFCSSILAAEEFLSGTYFDSTILLFYNEESYILNPYAVLRLFIGSNWVIELVPSIGLREELKCFF